MTVPGMQESWLENGQQGPLLTRVPIGGNLGSPSNCKSLSVEFDWQEKIPYACLLVRILKMSPCMEYKDKKKSMLETIIYISTFLEYHLTRSKSLHLFKYSFQCLVHNFKRLQQLKKKVEVMRTNIRTHNTIT